MTNQPPVDAVAAMESGTANITRRIEFYESDGVTPWNFSDFDSRVVTGSITLDYTRDERRMIDLTLRNDDGALRPNPYAGLWYDKVIKPFRGIQYRNASQTPSIVIIEEPFTNAAYILRQNLLAIGFPKVDVNIDATLFEQVSGYDIIVSYKPGSATLKYNLLSAAYAAGRGVISLGRSATSAHLPFVVASSATSGNITYNINPVTTDIPISKSWVNETSVTTTSPGQRITIVDSTATVIATSIDSGVTFFTGIIAQNQVGGKWFHHTWPNALTANSRLMWRDVISWIKVVTEYSTWEIQLGEYLIDKLDADNFPYQLKLTGRDYTKRPLLSKVTKAIAWEAGTPAIDLIQAVAANAGIIKMKLPKSTLTLPSRVDYAPETPRWTIMKEIANSFSYDIFFDARGYLTMQKFQDPVFSPIAATFKTGVGGNLVKYSRSVSDTELYNRIIITSEGGADDVVPFYGEAVNDEPSSPTRVDRIGDRPYFQSLPSMESDEACLALAQSLLKVYALESYDFSFDSICYPWLDVGDIAKVIEPGSLASDPTQYLLTGITVPYDLGPMSVTAGRVTFIRDSTIPDTNDQQSTSSMSDDGTVVPVQPPSGSHALIPATIPFLIAPGP